MKFAYNAMCRVMSVAYLVQMVAAAFFGWHPPVETVASAAFFAAAVAMTSSTIGGDE